jgi:hypothetical protein
VQSSQAEQLSRRQLQKQQFNLSAARGRLFTWRACAGLCASRCSSWAPSQSLMAIKDSRGQHPGSCSQEAEPIC